jgi:hypothetical protein
VVKRVRASAAPSTLASRRAGRLRNVCNGREDGGGNIPGVVSRRGTLAAALGGDVGLLGLGQPEDAGAAKTG